MGEELNSKGSRRREEETDKRGKQASDRLWQEKTPARASPHFLELSLGGCWLSAIPEGYRVALARSSLGSIS